MRWTIADLAHRAGSGEATVKVLEAADGVPGVGGGIARRWRHAKPPKRPVSPKCARRSVRRVLPSYRMTGKQVWGCTAKSKAESNPD